MSMPCALIRESGKCEGFVHVTVQCVTNDDGSQWGESVCDACQSLYHVEGHVDSTFTVTITEGNARGRPEEELKRTWMNL